MARSEQHIAVSVTFSADDLPAVRRIVETQARTAGLPELRRHDLVLAVDEIASNAVRHGGGAGTLDLWVAEGQLWFRVVDSGSGMAPGVRPALPEPTQANGRGLWIAHQVADQFTVDSGPTGTTVTGAFAVPA